MLPRAYRLKKDKDYERVFKSGRSFFIREIGIKYIKNNLDKTRIGIVMPKKTFKKPQRNLLKRQIRHIFIENLEKLKIGFDIMVIARRDIAQYKDFADLKADVEKILERVRLTI